MCSKACLISYGHRAGWAKPGSEWLDCLLLIPQPRRRLFWVCPAIFACPYPIGRLWTIASAACGTFRLIHLPPVAGPVAKQVGSSSSFPSFDQVGCANPPQPSLHNDSPTPKTSGSDPRHSSRSGTPIPSCRSTQQHASMLRHSDRQQIFYCLSQAFIYNHNHSCGPHYKKKHGPLLSKSSPTQPQLQRMAAGWPWKRRLYCRGIGWKVGIWWVLWGFYSMNLLFILRESKWKE